jgi:hypothetical protein
VNLREADGSLTDCSKRVIDSGKKCGQHGTKCQMGRSVPTPGGGVQDAQMFIWLLVRKPGV